MHTSTITSLPDTSAERHARMLKYCIAMGIRVLCFGLLFVVSGWWLVLPIVGAIVLPYIAVVIANAQSPHRGDNLTAPTHELTADQATRQL